LRRTGRRDKSQAEDKDKAKAKVKVKVKAKAKVKAKVKVEVKENVKNFRANIFDKKVEINDLSVDLWFMVIKLLGHEVNQRLNVLGILPALLTTFDRFSYSNSHAFSGLLQKALSGINAK
jgi:hypothetical protein